MSGVKEMLLTEDAVYRAGSTHSLQTGRALKNKRGLASTTYAFSMIVGRNPLSSNLIFAV